MTEHAVDGAALSEEAAVGGTEEGDEEHRHSSSMRPNNNLRRAQDRNTRIKLHLADMGSLLL